MAGIMSMWQVSLAMSEKHGDQTMAYFITRETIETIKLSSFDGPAEGLTTLYYDADGGSGSTTAVASSHFRVEINIVSDKLGVNGSDGSVRPSDDALRDVTITVYRISGNYELNKTSTYLARSGV
jgi:hypothetical protein